MDEKRNDNCFSCESARIPFICLCTDPPRFYCESCSNKHSLHTLLPASAAKHASIPGYAQHYRDLKGLPQKLARQALHHNLVSLSSHKSTFNTTIDEIILHLRKRQEQGNTEMKELEEMLKNKIEAAIEEVERKIEEPQPIFESEIAKRLFENEGEKMGIVHCRTNFEEISKQFQEMINFMKIEVEIDALEPVILPAHQQERGQSIALHITQTSAFKQGKDLPSNNQFQTKKRSDGSRQEIIQNDNQRGALCKRVWPDGSFYIGDSKAITGQHKGIKVIGIGGTLLGLCLALLITQLSNQAISPHATIEFTEGVYIGQRNDQGEAHGYGKMTYTNGDVYEGLWSHSERSGFGILKSTNDEVSKGEWQSNVLHGLATKLYSDGKTFTGYWSNGTPQGLGVLQTAKSSLFFGEFVESGLEGIGCHITKKGEMYVGKFKGGRKEGEGVEYTKKSLCYGSFQSGSKHGSATCLWTDYSVYSGDWKGGIRSGIGTEYYPAEAFKGEWENDERKKGEYVSDEKYKNEFKEQKSRLKISGDEPCE